MSTQLESVLRKSIDTRRTHVAPRRAHGNELFHRFLFTRLLPGLLSVNPATHALPTNPLTQFYTLGFPQDWKSVDEAYLERFVTLNSEVQELFNSRLTHYQQELKSWSKVNLMLLAELSKKDTSKKRVEELEEELVPLEAAKLKAFNEFFWARCLEETVRTVPFAYENLSVENTGAAVRHMLRVTAFLPKDHPNRHVVDWHKELNKLTEELFGT